MSEVKLKKRTTKKTVETKAKKTTKKTSTTVKVKKATVLKENLSSLELVELIKKTLEDGKADDIIVIDLKDKTNIADFMVVASGTSSRHVASLSENLVTKLKKNKIIPSVEGQQQADWVLVDALNVIIHLFRPEVRQYYNIEKMWGIVSNLRDESKVG